MAGPGAVGAIGEHYDEARARLDDLVRSMPDAASVPVPACPGWSVRDVIAHLVAVAEDVSSGQLTRPPDADEAAAGVARTGSFGPSGRGNHPARGVGFWGSYRVHFGESLRPKQHGLAVRIGWIATQMEADEFGPVRHGHVDKPGGTVKQR